MNKLLFISFYLIIVQNILYAQFEPYNKQTQFTVEEGLPSNECHDIVQDSLGYVWIATDRGLARYDGYDFKVYGTKKGLKDLSCLSLFLDNNNDIWINTVSKNIYKYSHQNDRISLFEHNDKMANFHNYSDVINEIYVDSNKTVYVNMWGASLVSIDANGHLNQYSSENPNCGSLLNVIEDNYIFSTDCLDEKQIRKENPSERVILDNGSEQVISQLSYEQNLYTIPVSSTGSLVKFGQAYSIGSNEMFVSSHGMYYTIRDSMRILGEGPYISDLVSVSDGGFFTAQISKLGVKYYNDLSQFQNQINSAILEHVSASRLLLDSDERLWVCTLEDGIFLLSKTELNSIKNNDLAKGKISEVEISKKGQLYYVKDDILIGSYDIKLNKTRDIELHKNEVSDLLYDEATSMLVAGANFSVSYDVLNKFFKSFIHTTDRFTLNKDSNTLGNEVGVLGNNNFVFVNSTYLVEVDHNTLEEKYSSQLEAYNLKLRLNSVSSYDLDGYLLGTVQGLYTLIDNQYSSLDSLFPVFSSRINKIQKSDDVYFIGTQGAGLLIWDGGNELLQLNTEQGLASDIIENISQNKNGQIYLSTYAGLSVLYPRQDGYIIHTYKKSDGLPSDEVYDVDYYHDTLYVATGKGMVKLTLDNSKTKSSHMPLVESVIVNDSIYSFGFKHKEFAHSENNIQINFKTIDFSAFGNINYRYRVNNETWAETKQTSVNFINLPPDNYLLDFQSKNSNGTWSPSRSLSFEIKKPWWSQVWFLVLLSSLLALSLYKYNRGRINKIRQEAQIKEDVRDLERQALQAQMNPHFIFNCLNAIQNYIMSNNKAEAMAYLSTFAKLIRQSLEASSQNKIALDHEIGMLKNYLELEKMRFESRFDYKIELPNFLDVDELKIPPLLIQPFVENAVLHGMKHRKDGGLIIITFEKKEDYLKVQVLDNGDGIKPTSQLSSSKSYGVGITQKRLAHINSYQGSEYELDIKSSAEGTEVNLDIKV